MNPFKVVAGVGGFKIVDETGKIFASFMTYDEAEIHCEALNQKFSDSRNVLVGVARRAYEFVINSENYHSGGEPANRLVQDLHNAIAQSDTKAARS